LSPKVSFIFRKYGRGNMVRAMKSAKAMTFSFRHPMCIQRIPTPTSHEER
jgi:hypothetical protein